MKFYEIQHLRTAANFSTFSIICCSFFCVTTESKSLNFSSLNLRIFNGEESTKAIKLIAPSKYTINSLSQTCPSRFSSHSQRVLLYRGLWRSCMASELIGFMDFFSIIFINI